jgi:hypothetical protein
MRPEKPPSPEETTSSKETVGADTTADSSEKKVADPEENTDDGAVAGKTKGDR